MGTGSSRGRASKAKPASAGAQASVSFSSRDAPSAPLPLLQASGSPLSASATSTSSMVSVSAAQDVPLAASTASTVPSLVVTRGQPLSASSASTASGASAPRAHQQQRYPSPSRTNLTAPWDEPTDEQLLARARSASPTGGHVAPVRKRAFATALSSQLRSGSSSSLSLARDGNHSKSSITEHFLGDKESSPPLPHQPADDSAAFLRIPMSAPAARFLPQSRLSTHAF